MNEVDKILQTFGSRVWKAAQVHTGWWQKTAKDDITQLINKKFETLEEQIKAMPPVLWRDPTQTKQLILEKIKVLKEK